MTARRRNLESLSVALTACFGRNGNFTVIVEEPSDNASSGAEVKAEAKRTEFKVWSVLLAQWSPVFEKMVGSDNYAGSQKAQVVIQDFSAAAVEIFLRFMYSGSVGGSATALVEVAAVADKYQVMTLQTMCVNLVREELLTPDVACKVFASADRYHVDVLRAEALDLILTEPWQALKERPALRPELLEEILSSGLLCIEEDALKYILQSWGKNAADSLDPIIEAQPQLVTGRTRGEHTTNVLGTLWDRYHKDGKRGAFLGYWVVVILGPQQAEMGNKNAGVLQKLAHMHDHDLRFLRFTFSKGWVQWLLPHSWVRLLGFSFRACPYETPFRIWTSEDGATTFSKGWVQWLLPHSWVRLLGFSFRVCPYDRETPFRIWTSEDCATWHLAFESNEHGDIDCFYSDCMPCKKPPGLVKCFKLEVLEGQITMSLRIHGIILQSQEAS